MTAAVVLVAGLAVEWMGGAQANRGCTWKVRSIPRFTVAELSVERFVTEYVRPGLPVIIEQRRDDLPWSFESLAERCFADARIPVARSGGRVSNARWARLEFMGDALLRDFAEKLRASDVDNRAGNGGTVAGADVRYGFDLNLALECTALLENFVLPPHFGECALQRHYVHAMNGSQLPHPLSGRRSFSWPSLMMGQRGTRSELHYDQAGLPFWMAVLRGRKLFRMMPFAYNLHLAGETYDYWKPWPMHRSAAENRFAEEILGEYFDGGAYTFEAFDGPNFDGPNFAEFPQLCEATVSEAVVGPGDWIFIPTGAPHGAVNLDATIAITSNYFSPSDDLASLAWFKRKCAQASPDGVLMPPHICAALLKAEAEAEPWAERKARTFFEIAGFSGSAEWCAFQKARIAEYPSSDAVRPRAAANFARFCKQRSARAEL